MDKIKSIKRANIYLGVIALILIDQLVKLLIINNIKYKSVAIIKGILTFSYCENKGVAFSFGNGRVPLFIVINLIIIGGLIFYFEKNRNEFKGKLSKIFFTMVIAGGIGNLIDRLLRGYVIDFLSFNILGYSFPIFNIADIGIVVGTLILFLDVYLDEKRKKNESSSK